MKQSEGFNEFGASVVTVITGVVSFILLSYSINSFPLGAAYTIWT
ncbi:SMR family transporter [Pseudomonas sp. TE21394]